MADNGSGATARSASVVLYTTEPCGFCRQAKTLLKSRGVPFDEVNLSAIRPAAARSLVLTGQMTFLRGGRRALGRRLSRACGG